MAKKKEVARRLAKKTLLTNKEAAQVVDELFRAILDELIEGEDGEVIITGFGKFYLYEHAARPVRNPKTQEEMILKPYKSLKFKPSDNIKNLLKELSYNDEL